MLRWAANDSCGGIAAGRAVQQHPPQRFSQIDHSMMRRCCRKGDPRASASARRIGGRMYLPRIYDQAARTYRVRYAIATILRDRAVNEGAFNTCFEMEDAEEVICTILRRGLKNQKLRAALERSHLINLAQWLATRPQFSEAYHDTEVEMRRTSPKLRGRNS